MHGIHQPMHLAHGALVERALQRLEPRRSADFGLGVHAVRNPTSLRRRGVRYDGDGGGGAVSRQSPTTRIITRLAPSLLVAPALEVAVPDQGLSACIAAEVRGESFGKVDRPMLPT